MYVTGIIKALVLPREASTHFNGPVSLQRASRKGLCEKLPSKVFGCGPYLRLSSGIEIFIFGNWFEFQNSQTSPTARSGDSLI